MIQFHRTITSQPKIRANTAAKATPAFNFRASFPQAEAVIRDPGEGFDPASIPSPILGENIFESHGRGIFLINELMDEVRYERGGTEIHMIKR